MTDQGSTSLRDREPTWLDTAYILKILSGYSSVPVKAIKSFTKEPATCKGENYASMMHLVKANYTVEGNDEDERHVSLIVKSRLDNELMSAIEEEFDIFQRESQVYRVILKECETLLESIGDETKFGPRAIYIDERVIVQENLRERGYSIDDIKKGLNFEQCKMILEKLAKFHACSMILYRRSPEIFKQHLPGNLTENPSPLHDLYKNAIETCVDYCKTQPNLQEFVSRLENFGEKIIPKMINVFSRNQNDRFHALNHGDMWVNNFMFKTGSDERLEDILFVDYQEGYFGSPGIDWNYFIYSSWQKGVFTDYRETLIKDYHKVLADTLYQLKYDQRIPTVEDVKKEIINKGYHGLTTATCLLPILINEHQDLSDPMNFLADTDEAKTNRFTVFNNPKYGEFLKLFLDDFSENGIL